MLYVIKLGELCIDKTDTKLYKRYDDSSQKVGGEATSKRQIASVYTKLS